MSSSSVLLTNTQFDKIDKIDKYAAAIMQGLGHVGKEETTEEFGHVTEGHALRKSHVEEEGHVTSIPHWNLDLVSDHIAESDTNYTTGAASYSDSDTESEAAYSESVLFKSRDVESCDVNDDSEPDKDCMTADFCNFETSEEIKSRDTTTTSRDITTFSRDNTPHDTTTTTSRDTTVNTINTLDLLLHPDNHLFNWHVITQTLHDFVAMFPDAESAKQAFLAAFGHVDSPLKSIITEYFEGDVEPKITCSIYSLRAELESRDESDEAEPVSRDTRVDSGSRGAPPNPAESPFGLSSRATILKNQMVARLRYATAYLLPDNSRDSVNAARAAHIELAKSVHSCLICQPLLFQHDLDDCPLSQYMSFRDYDHVMRKRDWEDHLKAGGAFYKPQREAKRVDLSSDESGRENATTQSEEVQSTQGVQNLFYQEQEDTADTSQTPQSSISQVRVNTVEERGGDGNRATIANKSPTTTETSSKPESLRYLIVHNYEFSEYPGIAWLMDTGCEGIAGVTSRREVLVNIRRGLAFVHFGTTRHTATEVGDISLGNGEFVRGIYVLPFLNPNVNILNPTRISIARRSDLVWTRDKVDRIEKAGTKKIPEQFTVLIKSTLSYIVLPILKEDWEEGGVRRSRGNKEAIQRIRRSSWLLWVVEITLGIKWGNKNKKLGKKLDEKKEKKKDLLEST